MKNFFFPKQCLHCKEPLQGRQNFLCAPCHALLQWVPAKGRCSRCFRPHLPCAYCLKNPGIWSRRAALFEAIGPAQSLCFSLHELGMVELIASFVVVQLERLGWPEVNEIVCQPRTFLERVERGEDFDPKLVKALQKKLRPKSAEDPVILVVSSDGREVDEDRLMHRFPKELLRLDIATRHLNLTH